MKTIHRRTLLSGITLLLNDLKALQPPFVTESQKEGLPLPSESWLVEGCQAFVIPAVTAPRMGLTPWVWYAPTLPKLPGLAEKWMFQRFTAAGIAVAGIDVGESYGSPSGRAIYTAFYRQLTAKRRFSRKPVLLARSRGGLMTLNWAAENAEKVGGFAGIYPVCNLSGYPGLEKASEAYGMTPEQLRLRLTKHNPVDRLAKLAKARVPMFAIHGDDDKLVPLGANSGEVAKRYSALGGKMQLIVPKGQGHSMWAGFFECVELVDFVVANAKG